MCSENSNLLFCLVFASQKDTNWNMDPAAYRTEPCLVLLCLPSVAGKWPPPFFHWLYLFIWSREMGSLCLEFFPTSHCPLQATHGRFSLRKMSVQWSPQLFMLFGLLETTLSLMELYPLYLALKDWLQFSAGDLRSPPARYILSSIHHFWGVATPL